MSGGFFDFLLINSSFFKNNKPTAAKMFLSERQEHVRESQSTDRCKHQDPPTPRISQRGESLNGTEVDRRWEWGEVLPEQTYGAPS